MKKCFLFLIFILFNFTLYSQEGIGTFKINKTNISIITDVEKDIGIKCEITNMDEFYTNLYNDNVKFQEIIQSDSNVRLFYLSNYTISNIKLNDVYLLFYKDILINFTCDRNSDMDLLFTKKYGRPYIFQNVHTNVHNNLLTYDEHINKFIWKEKNITTISYDKKQIFDGINRNAESYFIIYNITYRKIIEDCNVFKIDIKTN